jgi:hypothetical protein
MKTATQIKNEAAAEAELNSLMLSTLEIEKKQDKDDDKAFFGLGKAEREVAEKQREETQKREEEWARKERERTDPAEARAETSISTNETPAT